jgi:beta-phosphoglucomutase-like phosphatase (HAD superfamily)
MYDMLRFKHIIWDFDGTLFDTYPYISSVIKEIIFDKYHIDIKLNQIRTWCEINLSFCFEKIATDFKIDKNELQELFNHNYLINIESQQQPFSGAIEMVKYIHKNGVKII